ncbi:MAG: hypothetical protein H6773_00655 [Pseudomonadales bacterium]|nr:hypothetical protein [Candidatus Woesebacteria bacterium]MCB9800671.1 hypothetical protein [Pseudomonadales bacterium]
MTEKQPEKITQEELNKWRRNRSAQEKSEALWLKIALLPIRPLKNLAEKKEEKQKL